MRRQKKEYATACTEAEEAIKMKNKVYDNLNKAKKLYEIAEQNYEEALEAEKD